MQRQLGEKKPRRERETSLQKFWHLGAGLASAEGEQYLVIPCEVEGFPLRELQGNFNGIPQLSLGMTVLSFAVRQSPAARIS
jgi:hypothetical protein